MNRKTSQQDRRNHSEIPVEKSCTKTVKFRVLRKTLFTTIRISASSVRDLALKSKTCTISEHLKNVPRPRRQREMLFLLNKVLKIKKKKIKTVISYTTNAMASFYDLQKCI